jgi:hypothetical protein
MRPKFPKLKVISLPSTRQYDARIRRLTFRYQVWRTQMRRLKDDGGRTWRGRRPPKPPPPTTTHYEGSTLILHRDEEHQPERHHQRPAVEWLVPQVGVHPNGRYGPLYYLDSYMVKTQHLLRTEPARRRLIVRGPDPLTFRALTQEWVRVPSQRPGKDPRFSVVGYHRWLCYVVKPRDH